MMLKLVVLTGAAKLIVRIAQVDSHSLYGQVDIFKNLLYEDLTDKLINISGKNGQVSQNQISPAPLNHPWWS